MAEELFDGEFWLPSEFLTDDDILMDFSGSGSSETSDDDCHLESKAAVLSTSPQSTLFGCDRNQKGSSSSLASLSEDGEIMNGCNDKKIYRSGPTTATFDLLNKASGEVARMKTSNGTGFFDCSYAAKGPLSSPSKPQPPPQRITTVFPPPQFYSHPHHFRHFPPHMMWAQSQISTKSLQPPTKVTKNNNNDKSNTRPLGLPPSAWPPLPGQAQTQIEAQTQAQDQQVKLQMGMFVGLQRDSVGTGVFLPRNVATPPEPKKKSEEIVIKTKHKKGSNRRNSRLTKAKEDEIQLPSEWVY